MVEKKNAAHQPAAGTKANDRNRDRLRSKTKRFANRLAGETSPYLLQHAHQPVNWYPWGEDAFAAAVRENKPIFLSVGYSTCHWCHVMAHESFDDEGIAELLNAHFVPIKVDREERPDVDRVYMTYVQAATGSGGWPMSVWLTPDLKPFAGGTYYPPEDRWGRPGFKTVLSAIAEAWRTRRAEMVAAGDAVLQQLRDLTSVRGTDGATLDAAVLAAGCEAITATYEPRYGGFGRAPKFPRPAVLAFLFRYQALAARDDAARGAARQALDMALFTLRKMADGGLHDHIGGGFHRYSVDTEWHVPHFEKMLYDQAQLVWAYLDAWQITHDACFAETARDILDYVMRDMTGPDGEFFSAEDADSPVPGHPDRHAEGAFYAWEQTELVDALGSETAAIFHYVYGVEPDGNVAEDPQGEFRNKNILIVRHGVDEAAAQFGVPVDVVRDRLAEARERLRGVRAQRPRPHRDDKTLTGWNGLMISAFARAAQVLEEPRYVTAAQRSAAFVRTHLVDPATGRLWRSYRDGRAGIGAYADDYAFLIQGLLDLYETSFDIAWLNWAAALQDEQDARFWDAQEGGYFSAAGDDASILLRIKEDYDGAEPTPNSVAALNLIRLSVLTGNDAARERAAQVFAAFASRLRQIPEAVPQMLAALSVHLAQPCQIVIAGHVDATDTRALLRGLRARFLPAKVVLLADGGAGQRQLARALPFLRDVRQRDGKATAYVCRNHTCQSPTHDIPQLLASLTGVP